MIDFHPVYIALKLTALIYAGTILCAVAALCVRYAVEALREDDTTCDCLRCRAARGELPEASARDIERDLVENDHAQEYAQDDSEVTTYVVHCN
jgi:hypothetical protein